jgi:hypothetical protein
LEAAGGGGRGCRWFWKPDLYRLAHEKEAQQLKRWRVLSSEPGVAQEQLKQAMGVEVVIGFGAFTRVHPEWGLKAREETANENDYQRAKETKATRMTDWRGRNWLA